MRCLAVALPGVEHAPECGEEHDERVAAGGEPERERGCRRWRGRGAELVARGGPLAAALSARARRGGQHAARDGPAARR